MTKIEEVKKLKKEYAKKFGNVGLDPFEVFFLYTPGRDLENEKKFLMKSLKEGMQVHEFEEAPEYFCEYSITDETEDPNFNPKGIQKASFIYNEDASDEPKSGELNASIKSFETI